MVSPFEGVPRLSTEFGIEQHGEDGEVHKQAALRYILDAWEDALHDGIEPEMLANAALFAALTDLIDVYGENAVAEMTSRLPRRIHHGEFTLRRTAQ